METFLGRTHKNSFGLHAYHAGSQETKLTNLFSANVFISAVIPVGENIDFREIHLLLYTEESWLFKGRTGIMRTRALKSVLKTLSALFAFI